LPLWCSQYSYWAFVKLSMLSDLTSNQLWFVSRWQICSTKLRVYSTLRNQNLKHWSPNHFVKTLRHEVVFKQIPEKSFILRKLRYYYFKWSQKNFYSLCRPICFSSSIHLKLQSWSVTLNLNINYEGRLSPDGFIDGLMGCW